MSLALKYNMASTTMSLYNWILFFPYKVALFRRLLLWNHDVVYDIVLRNITTSLEYFLKKLLICDALAYIYRPRKNIEWNRYDANYEEKLLYISFNDAVILFY